jgi:hypothetical protein
MKWRPGRGLTDVNQSCKTGSLNMYLQLTYVHIHTGFSVSHTAMRGLRLSVHRSYMLFR